MKDSTFHQMASEQDSEKIKEALYNLLSKINNKASRKARRRKMLEDFCKSVGADLKTITVGEFGHALFINRLEKSL